MHRGFKNRVEPKAGHNYEFFACMLWLSPTNLVSKFLKSQNEMAMGIENSETPETIIYEPMTRIDLLNLPTERLDTIT
jgi:hypothetical protein